MKSFGLGDVVERWIEIYLSGRVSRVHDREVSQGRLLFPLFVNDLPDALEALTLLFADDATMVMRLTQHEFA